jgi:starvation-inducible DNA-binding protein
VKGPNFIALHQFFHKLADEADEWADELAERVTALAGVSKGTLQAVAERSSLAAYSLTLPEGPQHLAALQSVLAQFGREIRASIDLATELDDAGTADLFTQLSREVDKQLWFVEAHLQAAR